MPSSSPHEFRYEPDLCSLAESETLREWRRARAVVGPAHRSRGLAALRRVMDPVTRPRADRESSDR